MAQRSKLQKRLDEAAEALLDMYFASPKLGENPPNPELQLKTFAEVVKYFGPRQKLGTEEKEETAIDGLRNRLHGGTSRRKARPSTHLNGGGLPDEPAGSA